MEQGDALMSQLEEEGSSSSSECDIPLSQKDVGPSYKVGVFLFLLPRKY